LGDAVATGGCADLADGRGKSFCNLGAGFAKQGEPIVSQFTPEESFLFQAHALVECYVKLGDLEANRDPLIFHDTDRVLGQSGKFMASNGVPIFRGQGALISVFYMFLVLPFEWKKNCIGDFEKFDLSGSEIVANKNATVRTDTYPRKEQALRRFRNALSHGRIGWGANGELVVEDRDDRKGYKYIAEYSMVSLGELAQSLNMAIANYIETVIKKRPRNLEAPVVN